MHRYPRPNGPMRALAKGTLCLVTLVAGFFGRIPAFAADVKMGGYPRSGVAPRIQKNRVFAFELPVP